MGGAHLVAELVAGEIEFHILEGTDHTVLGLGKDPYLLENQVVWAIADQCKDQLGIQRGSLPVVPTVGF